MDGWETGERGRGRAGTAHNAGSRDQGCVPVPNMPDPVLHECEHSRPYPIDTAHGSCAGSMLGKRLRSWPNIEPAQDPHAIFTGYISNPVLCQRLRHWNNTGPTLVPAVHPIVYGHFIHITAGCYIHHIPLFSPCFCYWFRILRSSQYHCFSYIHILFFVSTAHKFLFITDFHTFTFSRLFPLLRSSQNHCFSDIHILLFVPIAEKFSISLFFIYSHSVIFSNCSEVLNITAFQTFTFCYFFPLLRSSQYPRFSYIHILLFVPTAQKFSISLHSWFLVSTAPSLVSAVYIIFI